MNEALAQECVRRLICSVLRRSGFDAASPDALIELEEKVMSLLGGLVLISRSYGELARRSRASPKDMLAACASQGIPLTDLEAGIDANQQARKLGLDTPIPLASADGSNSTRTNIEDFGSRFLADSVDDTSRRAPYAPHFLPFLPPSHSYKRTPVYTSVTTAAQAKAARIPLKNISIGSGGVETARSIDLTIDNADARIALIDSRIQNTRLVEASLQNLIRATSKASQKQPNDMEEDAVTDASGQMVRRSNELVATLLKRYEKDAAVCNFESDWYGAGGIAVNVGGAANAQNAFLQTASQLAQRKKGRWKF